jgi:hypothetical protein
VHGDDCNGLQPHAINDAARSVDDVIYRMPLMMPQDPLMMLYSAPLLALLIDLFYSLKLPLRDVIFLRYTWMGYCSNCH